MKFLLFQYVYIIFIILKIIVRKGVWMYNMNECVWM